MADLDGGDGGRTSRGSGGGSKSGGSGDDHDEKLAQFIAITGVTSEDVANHWLEANAYSVESAVNMFLESGGTGLGGAGGAHGGGGASSQTEFSAGGASGWPGAAGVPSDVGGGIGGGAETDAGDGPKPGDPDWVRPADPYKRQRLVDDHGSHSYGGMASSARGTWAGAGVMAEGANPFRDFQEESRQAVLASRTAFNNGVIGGGKDGESSDANLTPKQKKLSHLFSPPVKIMFMGDFQAARQAAKRQKKWLLVNIQMDDEFASHRLNRDLWKDEMVQNVIECNCVFWQQPSVSGEAKLYCRRYLVTSFPHMALVDPRTGMKMWDYQGFIGPSEFIEKVTDITDKISFEEGAVSRLPPPPPRPPQLPPSTGGSEDQLLAAAIIASLDTSGGGGGGGSGDGVSGLESVGDEVGCRVGAGLSSSLNSRLGDDSEDGDGANGSGSPAAASGGGAISVDESDDEGGDEDEEEEDGDGDVAIVGSSAAGEGAGKARRHGKGKARERSVTEAGNSGGAGSRDVVDVSDDDGGTGGGGGGGEGGESGVSGKGERSSSTSACETAAPAAAAASVSAGAVDFTQASGGGGGGGGSSMDVEVEEEEEEEVLEEPPEDGCPEKTSIRFQFPTGARVLRTFRKSSDVRQLFLFVRSKLEGAKSKPFDVRFVRPPSSVRGMEGSSIEEAGLSNSAVVVLWED